MNFFEIFEKLIFLVISSKIEIFGVKPSGGGFSGRILLLGTRPDEILSFWFLMVRPQEKPPREKFWVVQ